MKHTKLTILQMDVVPHRYSTDVPSVNLFVRMFTSINLRVYLFVISRSLFETFSCIIDANFLTLPQRNEFREIIESILLFNLVSVSKSPSL